MTPSARTRLATLLLVALTAVWGSTFFLIRDLVQTVPPVDFLAVRFTLSAVVMLIVFWRPVRALSRRQVLVGMGLGALYGLAQIFQTQGLATTPASVSGFVTGTYVVLTPVFTAVLLRERVPGSTWAAVGLATGGLAVLSLNGLSVGCRRGDHPPGGRALRAAHRGTGPSQRLRDRDRPVRRADARHRGALHRRGPPRRCRPAEHPRQWATVLYMVVFASILALWVQTWAQAHMPATRAAIIMTIEPVFAAFFAVTLGDETATLRMVLGGALVLTAMYAVELLARRRPGELPAEVLHHEV